jgi:phosphoglycolate phosphatase
VKKMTTRKFGAVIFDLDGTLLDTLANLACSYNSVLEELELPCHPVESFRVFVGDGARTCMTRCLPTNSSDDLIDRALNLQQKQYETNWQNRVTIYDGILSLLNELEASGVKLAVLSNKDHRFTLKCISHFFPTVNFSVVQGFDIDVPHKPNPTGALRIAGKLKLAVNEIAFVGDTKMDMLTANACGMFSIGVLWGFREEKELVSAKADRTVAQPADIVDILL